MIFVHISNDLLGCDLWIFTALASPGVRKEQVAAELREDQEQVQVTVMQGPGNPEHGLNVGRSVVGMYVYIYINM